MISIREKKEKILTTPLKTPVKLSLVNSSAFAQGMYDANLGLFDLKNLPKTYFKKVQSGYAYCKGFKLIFDKKDEYKKRFNHVDSYIKLAVDFGHVKPVDFTVEMDLCNRVYLQEM